MTSCQTVDRGNPIEQPRILEVAPRSDGLVTVTRIVAATKPNGSQCTLLAKDVIPPEILARLQQRN